MSSFLLKNKEKKTFEEKIRKLSRKTQNNIIGCNAEGYMKLLFYYFRGNDRKPMCKEIMRICEVHAKNITADDTNVRVQVLS